VCAKFSHIVVFPFFFYSISLVVFWLKCAKKTPSSKKQEIYEFKSSLKKTILDLTACQGKHCMQNHGDPATSI
jgi:hypothetical protein